MTKILKFSLPVLALFLMSFCPIQKQYQYHSNGKIKCIYKIFKHNEIYFESYYENGKLKQTGNFTDGKQDRVWISFNPQGQKTTIAQFNKGQKHGKWKIFAKKGFLLYEVNYEDNFITDAYQYNIRGEIIASTTR